ncbi:hypothetical protein Pecwa_4569 [Pectobacterium parmentieri WPP163]|nr:hypothetical protein Pecwa_4569 [Pectobacterium parmentieri WPP163]
MESLFIEIKEMIIDSLNLEDISVDEIETDAPLFGEGLGLDSIDALELGLAVKTVMASYFLLKVKKCANTSFPLLPLPLLSTLSAP